jgi:hypothetical protein
MKLTTPLLSSIKIKNGGAPSICLHVIVFNDIIKYNNLTSSFTNSNLKCRMRVVTLFARRALHTH